MHKAQFMRHRNAKGSRSKSLATTASRENSRSIQQPEKALISIFQMICFLEVLYLRGLFDDYTPRLPVPPGQLRVDNNMCVHKLLRKTSLMDTLPRAYFSPSGWQRSSMGSIRHRGLLPATHFA